MKIIIVSLLIIFQHVSYSQRYEKIGNVYVLKEYVNEYKAIQEILKNERIKTALEVKPLLEQADAKMKKKAFKEAIEIYTKAFNIDPFNWKILYLKAYAKKSGKDYQGSIKDFEGFINRFYSYADSLLILKAYSSLGDVYFESKLYGHSISNYTEAIKLSGAIDLEKESYILYIKRANAYSQAITDTAKHNWLDDETIRVNRAVVGNSGEKEIELPCTTQALSDYQQGLELLSKAMLDNEVKIEIVYQIHLKKSELYKKINDLAAASEEMRMAKEWLEKKSPLKH